MFLFQKTIFCFIDVCICSQSWFHFFLLWPLFLSSTTVKGGLLFLEIPEAHHELCKVNLFIFMFVFAVLNSPPATEPVVSHRTCNAIFSFSWELVLDYPFNFFNDSFVVPERVAYFLCRVLLVLFVLLTSRFIMQYWENTFSIIWTFLKLLRQIINNQRIMTPPQAN